MANAQQHPGNSSLSDRLMASSLSFAEMLHRNEQLVQEEAPANILHDERSVPEEAQNVLPTFDRELSSLSAVPAPPQSSSLHPPRDFSSLATSLISSQSEVPPSTSLPTALRDVQSEYKLAGAVPPSTVSRKLVLKSQDKLTPETLLQRLRKLPSVTVTTLSEEFTLAQLQMLCRVQRLKSSRPKDVLAKDLADLFREGKFVSPFDIKGAASSLSSATQSTTHSNDMQDWASSDKAGFEEFISQAENIHPPTNPSLTKHTETKRPLEISTSRSHAAYIDFDPLPHFSVWPLYPTDEQISAPYLPDFGNHDTVTSSTELTEGSEVVLIVPAYLQFLQSFSKSISKLTQLYYPLDQDIEGLRSVSVHMLNLAKPQGILRGVIVDIHAPQYEDDTRLSVELRRCAAVWRVLVMELFLEDRMLNKRKRGPTPLVAVHLFQHSSVNRGYLIPYQLYATALIVDWTVGSLFIKRETEQYAQYAAGQIVSVSAFDCRDLFSTPQSSSCSFDILARSTAVASDSTLYSSCLFQCLRVAWLKQDPDGSFRFQHDQSQLVVSPWSIREPTQDERLRMLLPLQMDPRWLIRSSNSEGPRQVVSRVLRQAVDLVARRLPSHVGVTLNNWSKAISRMVQAENLNLYTSFSEFERDWFHMIVQLQCDSIAYSESGLASCILFILNEIWKRLCFDVRADDSESARSVPIRSCLAWESVSEMLGYV